MKKFVVSSGASLIELSAWIVMIALIITSIVAMCNDFFTGILILLIGLIVFVMFYFSIFLLIDINDNLTEINSKLDMNKQETKAKAETEIKEKEEVIDSFTEKYLSDK